MDAASSPQGLDLPRFRLHPLKGDLKGYCTDLSLRTGAGLRGRKTVPMKKPEHPGRIVRDDCLEPLNLSVTEGARVLGVTRQTLNNLVNEKSGISPEMAIRLAKAFGSTTETWIRMQAAHDHLRDFDPARLSGGRRSR